MLRAIMNWWRGYSKADMKSVTERLSSKIRAPLVFMSQIQKEGLLELYAICERQSEADQGKLEAFKQCEATC